MCPSVVSPSDSRVSTTLYFGPWYRRSPFFDATIRHGAKAFDIYNHMYLPAEYDDFQDWQYRLTLFTGIGYSFIETEKTGDKDELDYHLATM